MKLEAEAEANRMTNGLYIWLKEIFLREKCDDDVVAVYDKLCKMKWKSTEDMRNSRCSIDFLENRNIKSQTCSLIMKNLYCFGASSSSQTTPKSSYYCGQGTQEYPIFLHSTQSDDKLLTGYVENVEEFSGKKCNRSVVVKLPAAGQDLQREKEILSELNKVKEKCKAVIAYPSPREYLVTEQYDSDLRLALNADKEHRRLLIPEVVDAVFFLHRNNVVHCDLKPANILLKRNGFVSKIALSNFDRAVDLKRGNAEIVSDGHTLKYSPGWVSPEVFNGKVGMKASLDIDLFHLGLLIEALTRSACHEHITILPYELSQIFNPQLPDSGQEAMQKLLSSKSFYSRHVKKLCSITPMNRRVIEELYDDCSKSVDDLYNAVEKFEDYAGKMTNELKQHFSDSNSKNRIDMNRNFGELRTELVKEASAVKQVIDALNEKSISSVDLEGLLFQGLSTSFEVCSETLSTSVQSNIQSAFEKLQTCVLTTVKGDRESSHKEIVSILQSYETKLNSLQISTDEILTRMEHIREGQRDMIDVTRDLLMGTKNDFLERMREFSEEVSSINCQNTSEFLDELRRLSHRHDNTHDKRLEAFVEEIAGIAADMKCSSDSGLESPSMLFLTQLGEQVQIIVGEVREVKEKINDLPSKISADAGILMATQSNNLLEGLKSINDRLEISLQDVDKARRGEDLELCLKNIEWQMKSWLSDTIAESSEEHNAAMREVIQTQHKMTTVALENIHELCQVSTECTRQEVKEMRNEVSSLLQGVQSTVSTVLESVS